MTIQTFAISYLGIAVMIVLPLVVSVSSDVNTFRQAFSWKIALAVLIWPVLVAVIWVLLLLDGVNVFAAWIKWHS